jgi:hypothetical protein
MNPSSPAGRYILVAILLGGLLDAARPSVLSAETTEYEVTFRATWSEETHPIDFPPSPHFSGLIGGTHSDLVSFWNEGELASLGIKRMAELGSKTVLTQEVQAAITAGTADAVLSGGGINPSPGSVAMTFDVDEAFPLVTLVCMLAPSPDWFVGVSGLSLRENGAWIPQLIVDLVVYDAGTDSGESYGSPNEPTDPPVPIFEKNDGPFAENNVVGTFTFAQRAVGVPEGLPRDGKHLISLGPNPVRQTTRFQIRVPSGRSGDLAVYGVAGQLVRELFRGQTWGEPATVTWNRGDDRGALVPAGVYFVALRVDGVPLATDKIVVTR